MMKADPVNIDFKTFGKSFREYVVSKAKVAGSTLVYMSNGNLVEEDPRKETIKILKNSPSEK